MEDPMSQDFQECAFCEEKAVVMTSILNEESQKRFCKQHYCKLSKEDQSKKLWVLLDPSFEI